MRLYKTEEDLRLVIEQNKPENVIRVYWEDVQKYNIYKNYIEQKKREYEKTYPDYDEQFNPIEYAEYVNEIEKEEIDEETGEIVVVKEKVFKDDCYTMDDEGNQVLKEECQKLINEGKVRPTLKYFLQLAAEEWEEPEVDMNQYVDFIKPILLEKVNKEFDKAMSLITKTYPEHEQKTWNQQELEALAYKADPENAEIPLLKQISVTRGISLEVLVDKVIEKAIAYKAIVGTAIGHRQKAEDMITNITTIEELNKVITELEANRDIFYKSLRGE